MSIDPLDRYQSMMNDTHAPAHLSDQVLKQARAQLDTDMPQATAAATGGSARPAAREPIPTRSTTATLAFAVKRTRAKGFAIAACTVLALGLGGTALALGLPNLARSGDTPVTASVNSFQMVAFADEGGAPANGPVALSFENFMPTRTGAGPVYDAETGTYPGDIQASRSYNLNLTCTGTNIASITYELQGEGVFFNNWQLTSEYLESKGELEVGATVATTDQNNTFTVDYNNQDTSAIGDVHHEICLDYVLDGAERQAWDEFYASTSHERVPGTIPEDERTAWNEANNRFDLVLAQHDANVISQAKLVLTATFTDGTTATKTYRLVPVDNFEQAYSDYLATRFSTDGTTEPDYPALYTIEEIVG